MFENIFMKGLTMETMLSKALREFMSGPLNQLLVNLSGESGPEWEGEFKKFLRKERCWQKEHLKDPRLLEHLKSFRFRPTAAKFVVRDNFVVDTSPQALVKIFWIDSLFHELFSDRTESISSNNHDIRCLALRRPEVDAMIAHEMGGDERLDIGLAEVFSLMLEQPAGEEGLLSTHSVKNVFYVRDDGGKLQVICIDWLKQGWGIDIFKFYHPDKWPAGTRIFLREEQ